MDDCDQRCKHCYIFHGNNGVPLTRMTWDEIEKTLENCLDFCRTFDRLSEFYITGGDPILHPDFWRLLEQLHEKNIPFTIMENPLEALKRFGVDFLVNDSSNFADAPPVQILLTTFANHEIDVDKYTDKNPILTDFGRKFLGDFFQKGIEQGLFKDGDARKYGDIYWSFLLGKLLTVKKGHESEKPEVYVEEILDVFRR